MKFLEILVILASVSLLSVQGAGNCGSHGEIYPELGRRPRNVNVNGKLVSWRYWQSDGKLGISLVAPAGYRIKKGRVVFRGAPAIVKTNQPRILRVDIDPATIKSDKSCCRKRLRIRFQVRICSRGECLKSKLVNVSVRPFCNAGIGRCAPVLERSSVPVLVQDNGLPPGTTADITTGVQASGDFLAVGVEFGHNNNPPVPDAVYTFKQQGTSWTMDGKITGPGSIEQSRGFGGRVAIAGDLIVTGFRKTLLVHRRVGGEWKLQQTLTAPKGFDGVSLSRRRSLALSKDIIVSIAASPMKRTSIFVRKGEEWKLDRTIRGDARVVDVLNNLVVVGFENEIHTLIRGSTWRDTVDAIPDRPASVASLALHKEGNGKLYMAMGTTGKVEFGFAYVLEWQGTRWEVIDELIPALRSLEFGVSIDMTSDGIAVGEVNPNAYPISVFKKVPGKKKWRYVQIILDESVEELRSSSIVMIGRTVLGGANFVIKPGDFNVTLGYEICDK